LAGRTDPSSADKVRLMDATPVRCGASRETAKRFDLAGWADYGHDACHHAFYWGAKLLLMCAPDGAVTGFALINPKLYGEREGVLGMLAKPANRPAAGCADVCDKGFAGAEFERQLAQRGIIVIRPARKGEADLGAFPNWLRQRVESVIWTLNTATVVRGCGLAGDSD
jgi:CubicO group peptidase (beta-lactamase class C family)